MRIHPALSLMAANENRWLTLSSADVVIMTDSIYYDDITGMTADEQAAYKSAFTKGSFSFDDFKAQVQTHLVKRFGSSVKPGNKAIFIQGNGARRDADVLVAVEHRCYTKFSSNSDRSYGSGICFWTTDRTKIVNYPKQHSANCTYKHQMTSNWFKPGVRILKNMRNAMVAAGYLKEGLAPSYFLEGMLYNVPNGSFGKTYEDTIVNALNWIINCDRTKLVCANEQYYLLHPSSPVTWRAESLQTYLDSAVKFWKEW